ncbi:MAG: hypothetical protein SPH70_01815 [Candidatus Cryptobacteroides sp.]|nr:hypothetical protein [Bacteroidales bacterium]MDY6157800.1 hypothetical protein [Candidatus Cryptobacteroides sp.]
MRKKSRPGSSRIALLTDNQGRAERSEANPCPRTAFKALPCTARIPENVCKDSYSVNPMFLTGMPSELAPGLNRI